MHKYISKLFFLFVLFLGNSFYSNGQNNLTLKKSYIQVQSGVFFAKLHPLSNAFSYKSSISTQITAGKQVGKHMIVEGGLSYISKGFQFGGNFDLITPANPSKKQWTQEFNYLSTPFAIGFSFGKKVQFFIKQGFNLDFMLNNRLFTRDNDDHIEVLSQNDFANFKKFDVSLVSTIGINIPIRDFYIGTSVNSNLGLFSVSKNAPNTFRPTHFGNGIQLQLGYRF